MYTYKSKKGGERTVFTDKDIRTMRKGENARLLSQKEFNNRIKLLNECMKSDTHNCRFCN